MVFACVAPSDSVSARQMNPADMSERLQDRIPGCHQVCEQWTSVFGKRVSDYEIHRNL